MKQIKKVLVLGGGGFIGRNIVEQLVRRGDCHVTAADLKAGSNWESLKNDHTISKRFNCVIDDFSQKAAFEKLNHVYEDVYVMAAIVGVNRTLKYPAEVIRVNTFITLNILDWISKNPIQRLLFASSSENYSGTSDLFGINVPTSEEVPLCIADIKHPRWTYALTKMHGESAFIHSSDVLNYECKIVRYQNIIGPGMGFSHAIPHIVERFLDDAFYPIKIYGHDQTRAFCYIEDAVDGTVDALEHPSAQPEIYHIGNPEEISMETLTKFIGEILEYQGDYEFAPTYPGSVTRRCPDIAKAKNDFGYSPKTGWKFAVQKTTEWYKQYFESGNKPSSGGFETPESVVEKMKT